MHPEVEKLLKLQETDLQVQHYNGRIELLPKQLAALEAKLSGTLQSLEANKQQIAQQLLIRKSWRATFRIWSRRTRSIAGS
jgi:predicted  nucleic acid-binding Zn-ribbon protein